MMKPWIAALACALWSCLSFAQDFPSRALRLVVPFPPGGSTDIVARAIQPGLTQRLGQSVVIEHKPGAGSSIGLEMVARSPADGHIIVLVSPNVVVNPHLYKLSFDPMKDLVPITQAVQSYYILVVNNALPARTVADVVALAKAQPDKLTYGSWGVGAHSHLAGELLDRSAGVKTVHVPYKGSVLALADVMGGQITMMFDVLSTSIPQIRAGKLRAIAVTGAQRMPQLPDVPTVAESGLPEFESTLAYGILAPRGTPEAVVQEIHNQIARVTTSREFRERLDFEGSVVLQGTPAEFAALIRAQTEKWGKLIKAAGIKPE
jgi:tripartite-type tricarboxylate transporter receptor subunit TctC